jgi:hypothetical protein
MATYVLFKAWGVVVGSGAGAGSELDIVGAKVGSGMLKLVVGIIATGGTTEIAAKDAEPLADGELLELMVRICVMHRRT